MDTFSSFFPGFANTKHGAKLKTHVLFRKQAAYVFAFKSWSYYLFHICFSHLSFFATDQLFHVFVMHIFCYCLLVTMLVSFVYCNQLSQTRWLKQQKSILSQLCKPEA